MAAEVAAFSFLAAMVVAGYGLTLLGPAMEVEERLFFGAVVGAMATTLGSFLVALAFGFGLGSVLVGLALALGVGVVGWVLGREGAKAELGSARARWLRNPGAADHPWPLAALLLVCWAFTLRFLAQAYTHGPQGLVAGYVNVWGDWAAHLTYAGSFALGHNLPPGFPIDAGHHLSYPFLVDFMAAGLVPLGLSLPSSLVWSSGLLGLAFPGVMYLAGRRLVGGRLGPVLAVLVFALSGGLGFVFWFQDLARLGTTALVHIPREYTLDRALNYQWLNPVLAYLVPQRDILFGLPVVLIAAAVLWRAREGESARPYLFAGMLVGVTPLFHVHAYGTAVALFAAWALIERRRQWLWFVVPALVLGLPVLAWLLPGVEPAIRWQLGWMAGFDGHSDNWAWFWIQNTGLFIPLLLAAFFWPRLFPPGLKLRLAPIWLWFLVPNLAVFQPWDWDNTKYFVFWLLFGSLLVGGLLARLFRRGRGSLAVATACSVVLGLAGGLDLARSVDPQMSAIPFADARALKVAAWVRGHTPPRAIFLTAPQHNEPVPALAGRTVVLGYPGWVWSYGLGALEPRLRAVETMLRGGPGTDALLRRYKVSYVVIGPSEIKQYGASIPYWQTRAVTVYSNSEYTVFRLPRASVKVSGPPPPPGGG